MGRAVTAVPMVYLKSNLSRNELIKCIGNISRYDFDAERLTTLYRILRGEVRTYGLYCTYTLNCAARRFFCKNESFVRLEDSIFSDHFHFSVSHTE